MSDDILTRFNAIDWQALDIDAVFAFYNATGRPVHARALLVAPIDPALREEWRRQCIADLGAFQKRSCPGCAA